MKTKRLVFLSLLCAAALIIFIVELQIPPIVPVPGVKMGLANIITLIVLLFFSPGEAFMVLMVRIILGALITGRISALYYSLSGGAACFLVMSLLLRFFKNKMPLWVISVFGALSHNFAQLLAASLFMRSFSVFYYLPFLVLSGIISGLFCGLCAGFAAKSGVFKRLK